jgi:hypothetical protein
VGTGKFPGFTERPLKSALIEKQKEIDFGQCG